MCMLIALYSLRGVSSQAHELVLPFLMGAASVSVSPSVLREVLSQPLEAQCSPDPGIMPQGPGEGTCALGECETFGRGVQMRPATGCGAVRVGYDEPGSWLRSSASVPATTRSNSRLAARFRQPMQVRTGPSLRVELSSCETTADHSTGAARLIRNGKPELTSSVFACPSQPPRSTRRTYAELADIDPMVRVARLDLTSETSLEWSADEQAVALVDVREHRPGLGVRAVGGRPDRPPAGARRDRRGRRGHRRPPRARAPDRRRASAPRT